MALAQVHDDQANPFGRRGERNFVGDIAAPDPRLDLDVAGDNLPANDSTWRWGLFDPHLRLGR